MLTPQNKTSPYFSSSGIKPETEDKSGSPVVSKPESKTQQSIQDKTAKLQEETTKLRAETQTIHEDLKKRGFNVDSQIMPFSQKEVQSTKVDLSQISAKKVYGMSESEASKYASQSIGAMESKMAEISNSSAAAMNIGNQQNAPTTNNSNSNTVSNNTQNVTQITMDYIRNIKTDSEKTPHWRSMMG